MSDEETKDVPIRVNVAGFGGPALSVFAAYSQELDMLLVTNDAEYSGDQKDGFLLVTNQERDTHRDLLMGEEHLQEAIRAYFEMDGLKLLVLDDKAMRHNPGSKIERDGVVEGGVRYRIAPDITCGQVAVMYACLAAMRQRSVGAALDFFDEMEAFTI